MTIDSRAIIDPTANIADDVTIGPFTIIGPHVEIGKGTWIGSHVCIKGPTKIGCYNKIFQFASIGEDPQDKKYHGEQTRLEIGDHNIFREFCTISRGTVLDQGITRIGSHNLFMAYVHVAHDCMIGNETIFANNATLSGHVHVDDFVIFSGFSAAHQFCHIGKHSFLSAGTITIKDIPPFIKAAGSYAKPFGLNLEGLKRRNFSSETMVALKEGYNIIYRQGLTVEQAIAQLEERISRCAEIQSYIDLLKTATRGIIR